MRQSLRWNLALLGALTAGQAARAGLSFIELQEILPNDDPAADAYGGAVAIDGDLAVIGAPNDDDRGADSGSATVYRWDGSTWERLAKLTASDGAPDDAFGSAVTLDGDYLAVGAPAKVHDGIANAGAVYLFEWSGGGWIEVAKLSRSSGGLFGSAVAINGSKLIVGEPGYDNPPGGTDVGAVSFYERISGTWTWQSTLAGIGLGAGAGLGSSVDLTSSRAIAGAPDAGSGGAVRFYDSSSGAWALDTTISGTESGGQFGAAVAIRGSTALIGAPYEDHPSLLDDNGAVYHYHHDSSGWSQYEFLIGGASHRLFGAGVALSGAGAPPFSYEYATIGSPGNGELRIYRRFASTPGATSFSAYGSPLPDAFGYHVAASGTTAVSGKPWDDAALIFEAFAAEHDLEAPSGPSYAGFGSAASFGEITGYGSGPEVVIGAPGDDDRADEAGAAYVYHLTGETIVEQKVKLTAHDAEELDSFGTSVSLDHAGSARIAVGAPLHAGNGAVYIFEYEGPGWIERQQLEPAGGSWSDFGAAVHLEGDTLIVGAPGADSWEGRAYVYRYSSAGGIWSLEAELAPTEGGMPDRFGESVFYWPSIDDGLVLVGAPSDYHDDTSLSRGAVHVFTRTGTTWSWLQKLTVRNESGDTDDEFGASIVFGPNNRAIIGAPADDFLGDETGSAAIFGWTSGGLVFERQLDPASTLVEPGDRFGQSVGMDWQAAYVGTPWLQRYADEAGAVLAFEYLGGSSGFSYAPVLISLGLGETADNDAFGFSLATEYGEYGFVTGAPQRDAAGTNAGSAHRFYPDFSGASGPAAPSYLVPPEEVSGAAGEAIVLEITAIGEGTLSYQWRKDGMELTDGGNLSGTMTSTLLIDPAGPDDAGSYDVVISSEYGETISSAIELIIEAPPCPSDIDGDGTVGFGDLVGVLAAWGPCADCPEDVDGDGAVGFEDLLATLAAWGACP